MNFIPIANPIISSTRLFTMWLKRLNLHGKECQNGKKIEKYLNVKNAILFNNGTSSLHATLLAKNIGPGDEVILPTLSYISSANVVLYCGAKPVFCEIQILIHLM